MVCHGTPLFDQFASDVVSAQHLFGKGWLLWDTPVYGSVTAVNVQIFCVGFNKCYNCGGWLSVKKLTYMVFSLIPLFKVQKHGKKVHLK